MIVEAFLPYRPACPLRGISLHLLDDRRYSRPRQCPSTIVCTDLQQQMNMIGHDHIVFHFNGIITLRNLRNCILHDPAPGRKLSILRIFPKKIHTVPGANRNKVRGRFPVIEMRQSVRFSLWPCHRYILSEAFSANTTEPVGATIGRPLATSRHRAGDWHKTKRPSAGRSMTAPTV